MAQQKRHVAKALTYRLIGTFVTTGTAWMLSGDLRLSAGVLLVDSIGKIAIYYAHERVWDRINWGTIRQTTFKETIHEHHNRNQPDLA